jgi:hypothetical protein
MEAAGVEGGAAKITPVDINSPVDIYIYIVVGPTPRAPSPAPGRSHGYSSPEPEDSDSNGHPRENGVISEGRIRRIPPGSVDHDRVVTGNIDNFRIYRHNLYSLTLDNHLLLRGRFEIAGGMSFLPQSLNGVHDIGLLSQESFTQPLRPVRLLGHQVEDLRKRRERLDAEVPVHPVQGVS